MLFSLILLACSMGNHEWKPVHGNPDVVALWEDDTQIGLYKLKTGQYFKIDHEGNQTPDTSPVGIPEEYGLKYQEDSGNFGLDWEKIKPAGESFKLNGRSVSKRQVYGFLEGKDNSIDDDSSAFRLTVIGEDKERKELLEKIKTNKQYKDYSADILVQSYPKNHWAVKDKGFETNDKATVYLQKASGEVIYSGADPEGLFDGLKRLRSPSGPLDIKWNSWFVGFNPFTWMVGFKWTMLKIPGEVILLVLATIFGIFWLRSK